LHSNHQVQGGGSSQVPAGPHERLDSQEGPRRQPHRQPCWSGPSQQATDVPSHLLHMSWRLLLLLAEVMLVPLLLLLPVWRCIKCVAYHNGVVGRAALLLASCAAAGGAAV
jgi:hypothetical protein